MAPGITSDLPVHALPSKEGISSQTGPSYPEPLQLRGVLDKFAHIESTPIIGREYPNVNIVDDIFNADNSDELLRDLAITISQRGVVFFRAQDNLTNDLQKKLVHRMGQLTGKPADSKLHIHPVFNNTSEFGVDDAEISTISSQHRKQIFQRDGNKVHRDPRTSFTSPSARKYDSPSWHSDIQFEPVPADYTSLRLTQLPPTGGDTLWASGYEIYDRFSRAYQRFLEGLTATFEGESFTRAARAQPDLVRIDEGPRGSPANVGAALVAVHPVVRTNPVTGWKSVYPIGPFPKYINELNVDESDELLSKLQSVLTANHDLQVRFKWSNVNDIAIWDNRSFFHTATLDYDHLGERTGNRSVGIGEKPYFDPNSKSRTEDLFGKTA